MAELMLLEQRVRESDWLGRLFKFVLSIERIQEEEEGFRQEEPEEERGMGGGGREREVEIEVECSKEQSMVREVESLEWGR